MLVMKFGGTSLGSGQRIATAVRIVSEQKDAERIVVVSAITKVTDALIQAAYAAAHGTYHSKQIAERHQAILNELGLDPGILQPIIKELDDELHHIAGFARLTPELLDRVVSFGERLSSRIVALHANTKGLPAVAVDAFGAGMLTDARFGRADILPETFVELRRHIKPLLEQGKIPVITGFIGATKGGQITTLGRGGSDYSAAIIGAAFAAREIQIWTDVNGVMTADPKLVPQARNVAQVSFDEASELAYFGAKVLHPKTLLPAMQHNIPVRVLNTLKPEDPGTLILPTHDGRNTVKAIALKRDVSLITIKSLRMMLAQGFLHRVFRVFDQHEISVDMIATSEVSVSLTVDRGRDIEGVLRDLSQFAEVRLEYPRTSITIVGHGIRGDPAVTERIFSSLAQEGISVEMISQGATEISLGLVVGSELADKAIAALHRSLIEEVAQ